MIRSLAALFAKKTAIVAITGVTVIGGATLALAVEGDFTSSDETSTDVECDDGTFVAEGDTCPEPEVIEDDCDDPNTEDVTETCPEPEVTEEDCDDPDTEDADETCPEPETQPVDDGEGEGDDQTAEHPENHGKYVSEAAKGAEGSPCHGLTGRDKGQCVAGVAQFDIGKKTAEEPAATTETVNEQPAPVDEPAAASVTQEPKAKPTQAGPPAGKGGGGKGKGGKG